MEPGDDAMGAFSRRLRGGGIEQLLPERERRHTAHFGAARCSPGLTIIACVQLLLTIRHRGAASWRVLDCRRVLLSPPRRANAGSRGSAHLAALGPRARRKP